MPITIETLNENDLFLAPPTLDLFFPRDGVADILELLVIHQPAYVPVTREPLTFLGFVLPHSPMYVITDPGIEHPGRIGDDVHEVEMFLHSQDQRQMPCPSTLSAANTASLARDDSVD